MMSGRLRLAVAVDMWANWKSPRLPFDKADAGATPEKPDESSFCAQVEKNQ